MLICISKCGYKLELSEYILCHFQQPNVWCQFFVPIFVSILVPILTHILEWRIAKLKLKKLLKVDSDDSGKGSESNFMNSCRDKIYIT